MCTIPGELYKSLRKTYKILIKILKSYYTYTYYIWNKKVPSILENLVEYVNKIFECASVLSLGGYGKETL